MNKFERPELDLRAALRIVRQNLPLILLPIVLLTGLQLGLALRETPLYAASTELLLQPKSTETLGSGVSNANTAQTYDLGRVLATEIRVLESETIAKRAAKKLGFPAFASGSTSGESDILAVSAVNADPDRAANVANTFAAEYIKFRREQSVKDLTDASRELQASADRYQKEIDAVNAQLADPIGVDAPTRTALELKRDGLIRQQQVYTARIDGLALDASLKSGGASVLTPAYASSVPISPRPLRSAILGMFLGLMLGLGLAFLREFLDDRIKTRDDIVALAAGKPVLGLIPFFKRKKLSKNVEKVASMERHPTFIGGVLPPEAAEAYRSLRTSIQFVAIDKPIRVIQVTSSKSGEGKTTTVTNLALALAQSGLSVMVVDGDLRHPRVHEFFGIANDVGFSSVLSGALGIAKASQFIDGLDDITVLPAGPIPPNPAELLGSERARAVLSAILDHYDMVLIDGPPVLPVVDAVVLSQLVDATIVVARVGKSTRADLASTMETLTQANAPVAGFVLNSVPRARRYGYGRYGYNANTYGYGGAGTPARPRKPAPTPTTKTSAVWVPDDSAIWNETDGLAVRSKPYSALSEPIVVPTRVVAPAAAVVAGAAVVADVLDAVEIAAEPVVESSGSPAAPGAVAVSVAAVAPLSPAADAVPDVPVDVVGSDDAFWSLGAVVDKHGATSNLNGSLAGVSAEPDEPVSVVGETVDHDAYDDAFDDLSGIDEPDGVGLDEDDLDDVLDTLAPRSGTKTTSDAKADETVRVPVFVGVSPSNGNHPTNGNHPVNNGVLRDAPPVAQVRRDHSSAADRPSNGSSAPTIVRERIVPSSPDTPAE